MNLFPNIQKAYSNDHLSAPEAQRLAQFIAFGPIVFQASRLMLKFGILERLRDREMTLVEVAERSIVGIGSLIFGEYLAVTADLILEVSYNGRLVIGGIKNV